MSINISGLLERASLARQRSIRVTGYLGTCLAAWAIGCSGEREDAGVLGEQLSLRTVALPKC